MGTTVQPRRIFRVTVKFTDGRRGVNRQIRCPVNPRKKDSLAKLKRRLADLEVNAVVKSSSTSAPARPIHRKSCHGHTCECFSHWTDIPQLQEVE